MTILDLKKDDEVWGGVILPANGGKAYAELLKVVKISLDAEGNIYGVRLHGNGYAIKLTSLFEQGLHATKEDFIYDKRIKWPTGEDVRQFIAQKLGLKFYKYKELYSNKMVEDKYCAVWMWDKENNVSKETRLYYTSLDLADLKLPDGVYATKEDCDKANKKTVSLRISREFYVEREESEAKLIVESPDEYEWQDGDECITTADIL